MPIGPSMSRETFLHIAEASGLDVDDPHMEELFNFVQNILPGLAVVQEMDTTDLDPALVYILPEK